MFCWCEWGISKNYETLFNWREVSRENGIYLRTGHYLSPEGGGVGRFWLCHQKHTWSPVKSCDIFMTPLNWQSVFYGFSVQKAHISLWKIARKIYKLFVFMSYYALRLIPILPLLQILLLIGTSRTIKRNEQNRCNWTLITPLHSETIP